MTIINNSYSLRSKLNKAKEEQIHIDLFLDNGIPYSNVLVLNTNRSYTTFISPVNSKGKSQLYEYTIKTRTITAVGYSIASTLISEDNNDEDEFDDDDKYFFL